MWKKEKADLKRYFLLKSSCNRVKLYLLYLRRKGKETNNVTVRNNLKTTR